MVAHVVIILLLLVVIGLLVWPYVQRRFLRSSGDDAKKADATPRGSKQFPGEIAWLLDAPHFIDEDRVEAIYDAVLRPDFEQASLTLSQSVKEGATIGADLKVTSGMPWIPGGEAGISSEVTAEQERATEVGMTPVVNPYRHLLALSLHYADRIPERLVLGATDGAFKDGKGKVLADDWSNPEFLLKTPRVLAMLELPPGTEFIPTALELKEKPPVLLFDDLGQAFARSGAKPPSYPGSASDLAERNRYWQWFLDHWNDREALKAIEQSADGAGIEWIDYRVPVAKPDPVFLHLRFRPRTKYESGVFAYSLVSRAYKHGLRLIGTLKSEPDLDVLAAFDC